MILRACNLFLFFFLIVVESNELLCHSHQKCEHHLAGMPAILGGCLRHCFLLDLCWEGISVDSHLSEYLKASWS